MEKIILDLVDHAQKLPRHGEEYEMYCTSSSSFNTRTDNLRDKIMVILDDTVGDKSVARNEEKLFELVSQLREESHVAADQAKGLSNTTEKLQTAIPSKVKPQIIGSSIRPQDSFEVDNSSAPFKPRLGLKPHAIVPLKESIRLERSDGMPNELEMHVVASLGRSKSPGFYCNPYEVEIRTAAEEKPPAWLWSEDVKFELRERNANRNRKPRKGESSAVLADSLETVPFLYVDTLPAFDEMIHHLTGAKKHEAIAVDLEHHSLRTFLGMTCIMQISTVERDFVIDTIKLRASLPRLLNIFADPSIVKVLHGADYDVEWLQRDFGLYVVQLFDTGQAARVLGYDSAGLAYSLDRHCHVQANKALQLADWRIRPLTPDMLKYAREDTHFLLGIFDVMRRGLIQLGARQRMDAVQKVIQRSADIASKAYVKPVFRSEDYLTLFSSGEQPSKEEKAVAKALYEWRDEVARSEDESPEYVLTTRGLLRIAKVCPLNQDQLLRELDGIKGSPLLRTKLGELIGRIQHALSSRTADLTEKKVTKTMSTTTTTTTTTLVQTTQDHPREFNCGVNSFLGCFPLDVLENTSKRLEGLSKYASVETKSDGLFMRLKMSPNVRLKSIDAKIASMAEEEMRARMENIETIKSAVDNILTDVLADSNKVEEEVKIESLRDRYNLKQVHVDKPIQSKETKMEVEQAAFQYTREMASKAGAIPPPMEPDEDRSKKRRRKSRWGKDDDDDDHVGGKSGAQRSSAAHPPHQEHQPKKKNPFILRPGGKSFAAQSATYVPK